MLRMKDACSGYGDLKVLFDVSLHVKPGQAVALVGSNGAGKTTLLQTISGIVPLTSGQVFFEDADISKMPAHQRANLGIAHVLQGRGIIHNVSIRDNLVLGTYNKRSRKLLNDLLPSVLDLFPALKGRLNLKAGVLSGGQQQMLAIARALMMDPKLLILDEPSLGLAPIVVDEVFAILQQVKARGTSMLVIEQNLVKALKLASVGYVMETGRIVMCGESAEILADANIRRAYLGI